MLRCKRFYLKIFQQLISGGSTPSMNSFEENETRAVRVIGIGDKRYNSAINTLFPESR